MRRRNSGMAVMITLVAVVIALACSTDTPCPTCSTDTPGPTGSSLFSGNNFVYRPGGAAGDNVYTDWAAMMADVNALQGLKTIQLDDFSKAPVVIPPGVWDMTQVELTGYFTGARGTLVAAAIADGASFINLRKIGGDLNLTNLNTVTAPVVIAPSSPGFAAIFELGAGSTGDFPTIINTGGAAFFDLTGLLAGQTFLLRLQGAITGSAPAIQLGASPGNFGVTIYDAARIHVGMIAGTNPGSEIRIFQFGGGGQVNSQPTFAGSLTHGQPDTASVIGQVPWLRTWMFPASIDQAPTAPAIVSFTTATGLGMNASLRFDTTLGDIEQILPVIRATAPSIGASASTPGALASAGLFVIIKNERGANTVIVSPNGTDTIDSVAGAVAIPARGARIFQSDGVSNWIVVGGYL